MNALFRAIALCAALPAALFAACGAAHAADLLFPIQTDTYLDSQSPAANYGAAGSVKALIGANGSACRGLFRLPPEVALCDPGKLARAAVCFYVFSNQTAGRAVTLYPLTRPFAEGSGGADGATWNTADGTNVWTSAGGDFDTNRPVVGVWETNGYFRWDITALLAEESARSNLLNHGALLQIDELPVPAAGTPRAPFTSSDGAAAERPFVRWTPAAPLSFPIDADTYLDGRSANAAKNYGAATTVKTLINNNVSGDGSASRGLFRLPPELELYEPGEIAEAKVFFYVWQDNTADLDVTLYPLTRPFAEGTGNGATPADGATWNTSDGTNVWTTPGGDYDANFPVVGVKGEILDPDLHDRFFSWDIAALLADPGARSNLLAHGAILKIDEVPPPAAGTPRAPFTSSDDAGYAAAYRPHLDVKVTLRTPQVPQLTLAEGRATLGIAGCTPLVAHRIERTPDLPPTNGWTFVANWIATGSETNWSEDLPPDWTRAFYRLATVP